MWVQHALAGVVLGLDAEGKRKGSNKILDEAGVPEKDAAASTAAADANRRRGVNAEGQELLCNELG